MAGPKTTTPMQGFGCASAGDDLGLIVGGNQFGNGNTKNVYLFSASHGSLRHISSLKDLTIAIVCSRILLSEPVGKDVVLCTGGRLGDHTPLGKTYVYDIATTVFERRAIWDYPVGNLGFAAFGHVTHDKKMMVQSASGVYLFKDDKFSQITSSHWHKMDVEVPIGFSAPFNIRYVGPGL